MKFIQAIPCFLLAVFLGVLATSLNGQECTPTVTGTYRATVGLNGGPFEGLPSELIDAGVAIAEQCFDLNVEFLLGEASLSYDDGANSLSMGLGWSHKNLINTSTTNWENFINNPINPTFDIVPCIELEQRPITELCGDWSVYSISLGNGPNRVKQTGEFSLCDEIEVFSPVATTIELPVGIGGTVLAAESFGDPDVTKGYAKLEVFGSMNGVNFGPWKAEVESTTVIPETAAIDETHLLTLDIPAGTSTFSLNVYGTAECEAVAQCTGFLCTITGSATANVSFPEGIVIENFQGVGGTSLPDGIIIRSTQSGMVYYGIDDNPGDVLPGDVNDDGTVDLLDVEPFVDAIIEGIYSEAADINGDGTLSLLDVEPFVAILSGPNEVLVDFSNTNLTEGDTVVNTLWQEFGISFGQSAILVDSSGPELCGYQNEISNLADHPLPNEDAEGPAISDRKVDGNPLTPGAIAMGFRDPVRNLSLNLVDVDADESFRLRALGENGDILQEIIVDANTPGTGDGRAAKISFDSNLLIYNVNVRAFNTPSGESGFAIDNIRYRPTPQP